MILYLFAVACAWTTVYALIASISWSAGPELPGANLPELPLMPVTLPPEPAALRLWEPRAAGRWIAPNNYEPCSLESCHA